MPSELFALPIAALITLIISFFAIAILTTIFWIFMLIDAAKRKFKNENEKVVWILVLALTGILGAVIYYFAIKYQNKH